MRQIGQLFLLRTNINSVGSVLDSPVSNLISLGSRAIVADASIGSLLGVPRLYLSHSETYYSCACRASLIYNHCTMPLAAIWRFLNVSIY